MTIIAFVAVAVAALLAGVILTVALAVHIETKVEAPLRKRQAERDALAASSTQTHWN